jgi:hypothetical protein
VQKSLDTIYISGLGSDNSERELTEKLDKHFGSIGRIKIDKKTNLPRSKSDALTLIPWCPSSPTRYRSNMNAFCKVIADLNASLFHVR